MTRHYLVESNFPLGRTNQKHYPDLGSDALSVWNFGAVSLKSFGGETSGSVAKCRLFSQGRVKRGQFFFFGDKHRGKRITAQTTAGKKATTQIHLDLKGKISGYLRAKSGSSGLIVKRLVIFLFPLDWVPVDRRVYPQHYR